MINEIPHEVLVTVPYEGSDLEGLSKFLRRYHLDLDTDEESEEFLDLFYNSDLRSFCGWSEDFNQLRMFPVHFARGWEDTYWKQLKDEALEFVVVIE